MEYKDRVRVKLISYTHPAAELEKEGISNGEHLIGYCARVSNPKNELNVATAPKLLNTLVSEKHWSPLEMVDVTLEIVTTRDIARQILRHRSFTFQEFSQRYADPIEALGFCEREARLQDAKNRQNSNETTDEGLKSWWTSRQEVLISSTRHLYTEAISRGIAKEVARTILPEGLTMSRLYMKGSLRSWMHYIELRSANGTQKEHQEVAIAAKEIIQSLYPMIFGIASR